jgi:hypothetical protein
MRMRIVLNVLFIMNDRDNLTVTYFQLGLSNKEILEVLAQKHGLILSIRTLKRITTTWLPLDAQKMYVTRTYC